MVALLVCLAISLVAAADSGDEPSFNKNSLPLYETRYHLVYTDLDRPQALEACLRVTKMAEEYHARTADFTGTIHSKLPFYLFKNAEEYYAAGGMPNTAGVFDGHELMAMADKRLGMGVWHVVQHEGFHQFAHAVIRGQLPPWVDEGLAEYFGEAVFTGDGMIDGVIPPWRLERVQKEIRENTFKPVEQMMGLALKEWNAEMTPVNYDQAWSMVHFLAHARQGRYQPTFVAFMRLLSTGEQSTEAWKRTFGPTEGFEQDWKDWWAKLPPNPTADLYARATVATLTSFIGRAFDQRQTFADFASFATAAEGGTIKTGENEWLPPSLLETAMRDVAVRQEAGEQFTLIPGEKGHLPQIVCQTGHGTRVTGRFTTRDGVVAEVTAQITGQSADAR